MKIIATVHDATLAVHMGCAVESESVILTEIDDSKLPVSVRRYFKFRHRTGNHLTLSLSFDPDCPLPDEQEADNE